MAAVARAGSITRDCVLRMAVASAPDATTSPPVAKRRRVGMKTSPLFLAMLEDVGDEICEAPQLVYLGTVSRVLPGNAAAYRGIGTEAAPVTGVLAPDFSAVGGFRDLMLVAKFAGTAAEELFSDVLAFGC